MPINNLSLSTINTQQLFDVFVNYQNYKKFTKNSEGIYCLFHKRHNTYASLYVGATINLQRRALRFFRKQNHIDNPYVQAVIKHFGVEKICVGIKYLDCTSQSELLIWEKIYQEQLNPIFNILKTSTESYRLEALKYFAKKTGLAWKDYCEKYLKDLY